MDRWFDFDLVKWAATKHPEWKFVFIGRELTGNFAAIKKFPNVHYYPNLLTSAIFLLIWPSLMFAQCRFVMAGDTGRQSGQNL